MNKSGVIFLFFMCASIFSAAQKVDYPLLNRVILNFDDRIIYAHFDTEHKEISVDDEKYYYWFNANDIKKTRGGYDGKILHGSYTEYYTNKNLKEKGNYKYGLRRGEWKAWYFNGELKEKINYKKGLKHKAYRTYYDNGKVKEAGFYLKGQLHKKVKTYDSNGILLNTERYKKGVLVKEKEPKQRKRKIGKDTTRADDSKKMKIKGSTGKRFGFFKRKKEKENTTLDSKQPKVDKEIKTGKKEKEPKKVKEKKNKKDEIKIRKFKKIVPADDGTNPI